MRALRSPGHAPAARARLSALAPAFSTVVALRLVACGAGGRALLVRTARGERPSRIGSSATDGSNFRSWEWLVSAALRHAPPSLPMDLTLRCGYRPLTPRFARLIDLASSCRSVCVLTRTAALQRQESISSGRLAHATCRQADRSGGRHWADGCSVDTPTIASDRSTAPLDQLLRRHSNSRCLSLHDICSLGFSGRTRTYSSADAFRRLSRVTRTTN